MANKSKRPQKEITAAKERRQDSFLAAFAEMGTISKACKASRVNRRLHYKWMDTDEKYVQKFCAAQEIANDKLEGEARRRAVDGWKEPVYYEGVHVGDKPKYSDSLLIFLLKGNLPQKYKERYEHSGDPERPLEHHIDLSSLSDEELRTLDKLVAEVGANG